MTATFYRIVTFCFALGGAYQVLMILSLGLASGALILLGTSALPIYFMWRHYDSIVNKTDFLPPSLLEEAPRYFNLCIAVLVVVAVSYVLTRLVGLISVFSPQPGMPTLVVGNALFGLVKSLLTPALFAIELGVWYHRGMRRQLAA